MTDFGQKEIIRCKPTESNGHSKDKLDVLSGSSSDADVKIAQDFYVVQKWVYCNQLFLEIHIILCHFVIHKLVHIMLKLIIVVIK